MALIDGDALELYSVRDVASLLGVNAETIRRLIHRGLLQEIRVRRALRVSPAKLDRVPGQLRVRLEGGRR